MDIASHSPRGTSRRSLDSRNRMISDATDGDDRDGVDGPRLTTL